MLFMKIYIFYLNIRNEGANESRLPSSEVPSNNEDIYLRYYDTFVLYLFTSFVRTFVRSFGFETVRSLQVRMKVPSYVRRYLAAEMKSVATFFPCGGTVLHRTTKPFLIAPWNDFGLRIVCSAPLAPGNLHTGNLLWYSSLSARLRRLVKLRREFSVALLLIKLPRQLRRWRLTCTHMIMTLSSSGGGLGVWCVPIIALSSPLFGSQEEVSFVF